MVVEMDRLTTEAIAALAVVWLNDIVSGGRQKQKQCLCWQPLRTHQCCVRVFLNLLGRLEDSKQGRK